MYGIIAVNGEYFDPQKASIGAMDRGFLFGDNVFEVFVGFKEKVLDIPAHLSRLRFSAEMLNLSIPWSDEELTFELKSIAEHLGFEKLYLRLVITRGLGMGLEVSENCRPQKIIYGFQANQVPNEQYNHGVSLKLYDLPYTERAPMPKTGNYLRSILAIQKSKKEGYQDVLWSNSSGEVTEASSANIFFIGRIGDSVEICTPSIQCGILEGITRNRIIRLLTEAKIPVEEKMIFKEELPRFDEAFLSSTVKGLIPIAKIEKQSLYTTRKTSVFKNINRLYQSWVASEIGYHANWNTGKKIPTSTFAAT